MSDPTPAPDQPAPDDPALRLAELAGEVARLKDTLLRSHADQQNQQRRHQRERDDLRKFAVAGLGHNAPRRGLKNEEKTKTDRRCREKNSPPKNRVMSVAGGCRVSSRVTHARKPN